MLPIVEVPETIRRGWPPIPRWPVGTPGLSILARYMTGLLLSPNKDLQGLYDVQVWWEIICLAAMARK